MLFVITTDNLMMYVPHAACLIHSKLKMHWFVLVKCFWKLLQFC